jgi:hypothetical protein
MTGDKVGHMRGIIPRSVEQIVEQAVLMRESGWEIIVTASMVRSKLFFYLRRLLRHPCYVTMKNIKLGHCFGEILFWSYLF